MAVEDPAVADEPREAIGSILANRSFLSVFQPIVDLATGLVVGYEALSRFEDRLPTDVFAEARTLGLELDLELLTLRAALVAARRLPGGRWLDVNISGPSLDDPRLQSAIGIADRRMNLELRAAELPACGPALTDTLRAFGDHAGLAIVVADPRARLPEGLEPQLLKLDRSLTLRAATDTDIGWLHALVEQVHAPVVAEGIETAEQARALEAVGIELGQGIHFGPPMPATVRPSTVN